MMRATVSLIRVLANVTFGWSAGRFRYLVRRERVWEPIVIGLSLSVAAGALVVFVYRMAVGITAVGLALGQPQLSLVIASLGVSVLILVTGVFAAISVLYFSRDLGILAPLPLPPTAILLGKFAATVLVEYPMIFVVLGPVLVAYHQLVGLGATGWLAGIAVAILLPMLPLALATGVALLMMRFMARVRHRDLLLVVVSILLVVGILGLQTAMYRIPIGEEQAYLERLLSERMGLVRAAGRWFPPAIWAALAVAEAGTLLGLGYLAALALATAAALAVAIGLGARWYLRAAAAASEVGSVRSRARRRPVEYRAVSPLAALFAREWKLFIRTPIYILNGGLGAVIAPVALLLPVVSSGGTSQLQGLLAAGGELNLALIGAALVALLGGLNTVGATSISREGRLLWVTRMLPVPARTVVGAKLLHALAATAVTSLPTVVVMRFAFGLDPGWLLAAAGLGLLGGSLASAVGLLFDLWRPFLHWQHPRQAVKNNLNVLVPMGVLAPVVYGSAALVRWAATVGWSPLVVVLLLGIALLSGALAAHGLVLAVGARLLGRIEI